MSIEVGTLLRLLERYTLCLEDERDVEAMLKELEVVYADEMEDIRLARERLCELLEEGVEEI